MDRSQTTGVIIMAAAVLEMLLFLYGDAVVEEPDLVVPHPRLAERAFVLAPLAELAPRLRHPVLGKTVRQLLSTVGSEGVVEIKARGWEGQD